MVLTDSPVHDESMGDDHLLQVVLVVSGDAEEVQLVALLIIGDLETRREPRLQLALTGLITVSETLEPLNHLFTPTPNHPEPPRPHLTRTQSTDRGKNGPYRTPAQPHPDKCTSYQWTPKQTHRSSRRDTSQPSPADTKPCSQRSSVLVQSQRGIWGVMLRTWEREEWEPERREEGLLTSSGTSRSPPRPLLLLLPLLLHMRRSSTGVLKRLRQNPVYLPNNLIWPTQPELKNAVYPGYYRYPLRAVGSLWRRRTASVWQKLQMTQF